MEMGVINRAKNPYTDVQMAPKRSSRATTQDDVDQSRKKLLDRLTNYNPKNDLYVDGKKHNKMGRDEFLKLLTHQLQNQDPLKPQDQGKMAADLAQFSQLEQLANLNTKFEKFGANKNEIDRYYGSHMIGKTVLTQGNTIEFKGQGSESKILFNLNADSKKTMIRIFDESNNLVHEEWKDAMSKGGHEMKWDGVGLDKTVQPSGNYRVQVYAWDKNEEPIKVESQVKGVVRSVNFDEGETVLNVDGKKVYLRDVSSFFLDAPSRMIK